MEKWKVWRRSLSTFFSHRFSSSVVLALPSGIKVQFDNIFYKTRNECNFLMCLIRKGPGNAAYVISLQFILFNIYKNIELKNKTKQNPLWTLYQSELLAVSNRSLLWLMYEEKKFIRKIFTRTRELGLDFWWTLKTRQPGMEPKVTFRGGSWWREPLPWGAVHQALFPTPQNSKPGAFPGITATAAWMLQRGCPVLPLEALGLGRTCHGCKEGTRC